MQRNPIKMHWMRCVGGWLSVYLVHWHASGFTWGTRSDIKIEHGKRHPDRVFTRTAIIFQPNIDSRHVDFLLVILKNTNIDTKCDDIPWRSNVMNGYFPMSVYIRKVPKILMDAEVVGVSQVINFSAQWQWKHNKIEPVARTHSQQCVLRHLLSTNEIFVTHIINSSYLSHGSQVKCVRITIMNNNHNASSEWIRASGRESVARHQVAHTVCRPNEMAFWSDSWSKCQLSKRKPAYRLIMIVQNRIYNTYMYII